MVDTTQDIASIDGAEKSKSEHAELAARVEQTTEAIIQTEPNSDGVNVRIGWRSWLVVAVTFFVNNTLVFVVVAAGSVIAFIIRDLGHPGLAGWIIQAPLLMQAVLCPIIGRLSDVVDRKYLSASMLFVGFIGSVVAAKAPTMNVLIGGSILIGVGLSSIGIAVAIPSEVLPLKYRAIANGSNYLGGACGGLIGHLGAGALTNRGIHGWRDIFWIQCAFYLISTLLMLGAYYPTRSSDYPRMKFSEYLWAADPIGSLCFMSGTTLTLLALDWTGGTYPWHDAHVGTPLGIGLGLLVVFCVYEWKGRTDGIVAHVFFKNNRNFPLATFCFMVEGWIYYSAVNSITPQIVLNLGFESTAWRIAVRQLAYQLPAMAFSTLIVAYSTKFKDLKSPLFFTFGLFLVVCICYATIKPTWNHAQIGFWVIAGIAQSGPLTLVLALVQFAAPHAFIATASGFALSARAMGGAFGSAVLNAIINSKISATLAPQVGGAATSAGLPASSVPQLLAAVAKGAGYDAVPGIDPTILAEALAAKDWAYARAYRLAWASVIPFVVLAMGCVLATTSVKELMTDRVEASVEGTTKKSDGKGGEA